MNRMILIPMIAVASCAAAPVSAATIHCPAYETKTPYVSAEQPGKWVLQVKQRSFDLGIDVKDIPPMGECAGYYRVEALPVWDVREHEPETRP